MTQEVVDALRDAPPLGDERGLVALFERAALVSEGPRVTLDDLERAAGVATTPATSSSGSSDASPNPDAWAGSFADFERAVLAHALRRAGGNKSEAARALGLKRTTFLDKLRRSGLRENELDADAS